MSASSSRMTAWLFLSFSIFCAPSVATAAPAPLPTQGDQDLIRDRQNRLLEEQQRRLEDLKNLPGKAAPETAPATPADTRCFTIQRIELKGADHLSAPERERLVAPYLGRCLGLPQLNEVLKAVTGHYLDRGLVTSRAYLPPQDLGSGTLVIQVVEGRLESLQGADGSGLSERELAMTFPGRTGEVLNLREVEQLVDQLNRLPSNQARMELRPGQAVGGSDVQVTNTPQKPWRASLGRSNDGQRSTGEQQWNTGLEWDSPLGLADQLVLRGGHDAVSDSNHSSRNGLLNYNLPWGWWNFNYSYSQSGYRAQATPQDGGGSFSQRGDSATHQLRAERVIYRDALSKTSVNAGLARVATHNYNDGVRLIGASNTLSEFSYGINHGRRIGNAFLNVDLGTQRGIGAFGAQGDHASGATARYRKYTATVSYLQPFQWLGESFTFSSLATGQRTPDQLYSSQRISLGGQSSVRGFKDQYLTGDNGGYWRNELRWSRPVDWAWLRPAVSEYGMAVAYDQGVISRSHGAYDQHGRMSSDSLELFARGRYLGASVTFAHSLERPDAIADREAPIYFSLNLYL